VLSQGWPRDATVNFGTYRIFQRHRVVSVSLLQHGVLVKLYRPTSSTVQMLKSHKVRWFSRRHSITLVLSCTVSEILQVYLLLTLYSNFGGVPVAPDRPCWASTIAWALSYSVVKLFSKNSNLCENHTSTSQTDRQTDGQTTYCPITALCATKLDIQKYFFSERVVTRSNSLSQEDVDQKSVNGFKRAWEKET